MNSQTLDIAAVNAQLVNSYEKVLMNMTTPINSFDVVEGVMDDVRYETVRALATLSYGIDGTISEPREFAILWNAIWGEDALGELESSNIKALGFHLRRGELYVAFHSSPDVVYAYNKETPQNFYGIVNAKSHGSELHKRVLGPRMEDFEIYSADDFYFVDDDIEDS